MQNFTHANLLGYTDIYPYEIVKHVSDKCFEVRAMGATMLSRPNILPGGFAGHCTNNTEREQVYSFASQPDAEVRRVRLHKNGQWRDSHGNRYLPGNAPRKFHDYNF